MYFPYLSIYLIAFYNKLLTVLFIAHEYALILLSRSLGSTVGYLYSSHAYENNNNSALSKKWHYWH